MEDSSTQLLGWEDEILTVALSTRPGRPQGGARSSPTGAKAARCRRGTASPPASGKNRPPGPTPARPAPGRSALTSADGAAGPGEQRGGHGGRRPAMALGFFQATSDRERGFRRGAGGGACGAGPARDRSPGAGPASGPPEPRLPPRR